jgi:hypothetical protein
MNQPCQRVIFISITQAVITGTAIPRTHVAVNSHSFLFCDIHELLSQIYALGAMTAVAEILLEHINRALNPVITDLRISEFLLIAADLTQIMQQTHYGSALSRNPDFRVSSQEPHQLLPHVYAVLTQTTLVVTVKSGACRSAEEISLLQPVQ